MGSLAGHVLPGSFFLIYGLAWVYLAMWTNLKMKTVSGSSKKIKRRESGSTAASTSFFEFKRDQGLSRKSWLPLPCCPRIPLEPIFKILFPALGIIAELFFDMVKYPNESGVHLVAKVYHIKNEDGTFNGMGKLHHITMYAAFLLSGLVDVLTIFVKFPRVTSSLFLSIAFWTEGILFYFHTHGRDAVNVQIHLLLTIVIFACVFFSLMRVFFATNFVINLGLACTIVLQGTWFIHAGYLLFPPGGHGIISLNAVAEARSDDDHSKQDEIQEHNSEMYVSAVFTWHVMCLAAAMLILYVLMMCAIRSGVVRRLSKRGGLLNKSRRWVNSEERERLIAADLLNERSSEMVLSRTKDKSDSVEMQKMFETDRAGAVLNEETGKIDSENEMVTVEFQNVNETAA